VRLGARLGTLTSRRVRGDRAGQLRLCSQHRDLCQAVPAQSDRDRQVRGDLPSPGSVGAIDPCRRLLGQRDEASECART
jgi:hypothetical protein